MREDALKQTAAWKFRLPTSQNASLGVNMGYIKGLQVRTG